MMNWINSLDPYLMIVVVFLFSIVVNPMVPEVLRKIIIIVELVIMSYFSVMIIVGNNKDDTEV